MTRTGLPGVLTIALAGIMLAQALLGRLFHAQYRDVEPIRTTWIGNDWVTLLVAVPLLLAGLAGSARGSTRARLLWLGLIAYGVYNYGFYLFGAALNAFLPLYVLALVTATLALIVTLAQIDADRVARQFRPHTPVRLVGGALVVIGAGLALVWFAMWAAHIFAGHPTPVHPEAFKVVAALDLWLMVPALMGGGLLLWRRAPWGFVIAAAASIQGALYLLVLSVNSAVAIRRGLADAPGELPIWGTLAIVTTAAAFLLLVNVRDGASFDG